MIYNNNSIILLLQIDPDTFDELANMLTASHRDGWPFSVYFLAC